MAVELIYSSFYWGVCPPNLGTPQVSHLKPLQSASHESSLRIEHLEIPPTQLPQFSRANKTYPEPPFSSSLGSHLAKAWDKTVIHNLYVQTNSRAIPSILEIVILKQSWEKVAGNILDICVKHEC